MATVESLEEERSESVKTRDYFISWRGDGRLLQITGVATRLTALGQAPPISMHVPPLAFPQLVSLVQLKMLILSLLIQPHQRGSMNIILNVLHILVVLHRWSTLC